MEQVFRPSRRNRNIAVMSLILFTSMAVISGVGMASEAPAGRKMLAAVSFPLFWTPFILLSAVMLWAYYKEWLSIEGEELEQQGLSRRRQIKLQEVAEIQWGMARRITVKKRENSERIRIQLDIFEVTERLSLIRFFREGFSGEIQHGWDDFCQRMALPLRTSVEQPQRPLHLGEVRVSRTRWDWYFLPAIAVSLLIGIVWNLPGLLVAPLPIAELWLILRFLTPKKGLVYPSIGARPGEARFLWFVLGWAALGMAAIPVGQWFGTQSPVPWLWGTLLGIAWFGILLLEVARMDRQLRPARLSQRQTALELWEIGERDAASRSTPVAN